MSYLLGFFLLILIGVLAYVLILKYKADKELEEVGGELRKIKSAAIEYKKRWKELERFQGIADIHKEIIDLKHVKDGIQEEISTITNQKESILSDYRSQGDAIISQAHADAEAKREEAQTEFTQTIERAKAKEISIIADANQKAEEIAGDAIAIVRERNEILHVIEAMKNTIKGYGDEYLIPTHSILDDMAEDWGHKEAGLRLKEARNTTKTFITEGKAADCDYAENSRKETAIRFVIDAFNGRVDAILSDVNHENVGKLKQQILDVFSLVNHNGEAFRNARIKPEYLDARLDELKWAVAVCELRRLEKEEQRQIREQMREEEKAQREIEKALREAEKEEHDIEKAMKDAQKRLSQAHEEERAKLEGELAALQLKLTEAEERNKRAISMAQQTKRGHVYIISNIGSFGEDVFKIGMTRRLSPEDRVNELGDASVPFPFDIHAMISSDDAPKLETYLHTKFSDYQVNKVNPRKEFFRVSLSEIKRVSQEFGLEAHWTMHAEAQDYRETRAIEMKAKAKEKKEELLAVEDVA